jgi:alcohol dehydrogenase (cytochrome c)
MMCTGTRASVRPMLLALLLTTVLAVPGSGLAQTTSSERLLNAADEPQNWLTHHKDYAATRYSPLDEINKETVGNLKVAWTQALGGIEGGGIWPHGGLEGTPIVEDGAMYVTDGWGAVYKLDLTGGGGELVWKMDPATDKDWSGAVSCCGVNNRGVALWNDKVISHTLDGRLIATDKATGEVAWERKVADPAIAEVITVAPLVVKDLAITGVSGAEYGIRGWIAATDLNTGKEVWRRHTIPGPGEPGHDTWADTHDAWKTGGGSTWVTGSYDPERVGVSVSRSLTRWVRTVARQPARGSVARECSSFSRCSMIVRMRLRTARFIAPPTSSISSIRWARSSSPKRPARSRSAWDLDHA